MHRESILVLALAALITLPWLNYPFYTRGEPREALVSQAMLRTGNWVLPDRFGDDFATKPPMTHWLISLFSLPEGEVTEFTARAPSALLSIVTVCALYLFLAARVGKGVAVWSAVSLLSMVEWYRASITARVDMTLSALIVLGFVSVLRWEERGFSGLPIVPALLFGMATLTKGPVALVLPIAVIGSYLLVRRAGLCRILRVEALVFVPALAVASVWYLLAYRQGGDEFLKVVLAENLARFFGQESEHSLGHAHSPLYLYATLLIGIAPWCILMIWDLRWLVGQLKSAILRPKESFTQLQKHRVPLFSVIAILLFLVFYSIPSSKRSVYLLPIYPFVAVLTGYYLMGLVNQNRAAIHRYSLTLAGLGFAALGITLSVLNDWIPLNTIVSKDSDRASIEFYAALLKRAVNSWSILELTAVALLALSLLAIVSVPQRANARNRSLPITVAAYFVALLVVQSSLMPTVTTMISEKRLAESKLLPDPGAGNVVSFGGARYGLSFYRGATVPSESSAAERLVVMEAKSYKRFIETEGGRSQISQPIRIDPSLPSHPKELIVIRVNQLQPGLTGTTSP